MRTLEYYPDRHEPMRAPRSTEGLQRTPGTPGQKAQAAMEENRLVHVAAHGRSRASMAPRRNGPEALVERDALEHGQAGRARRGAALLDWSRLLRVPIRSRNGSV